MDTLYGDHAMTHVKAKLTFAAAALSLCVGYLVFAGVKSGWVYYMDVDQFMAGGEYTDVAVRLCGKAADDGEVRIDSAALTAAFNLAGKTHLVPVVYRGVVPDNFEPGVEVVVEGKLGSDGVFHATVLMTKCASKYDEAHEQRIAETKS